MANYGGLVTLPDDSSRMCLFNCMYDGDPDSPAGTVPSPVTAVHFENVSTDQVLGIWVGPKFVVSDGYTMTADLLTPAFNQLYPGKEIVLRLGNNNIQKIVVTNLTATATLDFIWNVVAVSRPLRA